MSGGKQESVPVLPSGIGRVVAQFMKVESRKTIGHAKTLGDVALALSACHVEHLAPQAERTTFQGPDVRVLWGMIQCGHG
jgi:hypothetical protein